VCRPFHENGIEAHLGCYGLHLLEREALAKIPFRTDGFGQFGRFRQNEGELSLGVALAFFPDDPPPWRSGCFQKLFQRS
jgi:hypothetical protein